MNISDNGLALIKISEGFREHAYPDPGTGGVPWTIGYGRAHGVKPNDICDEAQATIWLREDCEEAESIVDRWFSNVPLNQGQYDALVDFCFNIGPGNPGHRDGLIWLQNGNHSTLFRMLVAEDFHRAALEFPKWANPPLPGLIIRRQREQSLFETGAWN